MEELVFRCGALHWRFGHESYVMGILNVTPDSFSDGGQFIDLQAAVQHGIEMVQNGAAIIDVGGESTRPGAAAVSEDTEKARVVPVIQALSRRTKVPISIDTQKAGVAAAALEAGACIINDISGLQRDKDMLRVLRESDAGCIVMHMRGTPADMQKHTSYTNLVSDIIDHLRAIIDAADDAGIGRDRFMIDPGIGFSKTGEQNVKLLANLRAFRTLKRPLLVGPSRKSFIGRILNIDDPQNRGWGTAAAVAACVLNGADVVRVHNVQEMAQVVRVANAIRNAAHPA